MCDSFVALFYREGKLFLGIWWLVCAINSRKLILWSLLSVLQDLKMVWLHPYPLSNSFNRHCTLLTWISDYHRRQCQLYFNLSLNQSIFIQDSIWGPAPAVNPHIQTRATNNSSAGGGDGGESGSGSAASKGKNRKKKQRMQKVDGSILGFTVHSDPNRKNAAGELESI